MFTSTNTTFSLPHPSPCFFPQTFSFGLNNHNSCSPLPRRHDLLDHYFTLRPIIPVVSSKSTPTNQGISRPNENPSSRTLNMPRIKKHIQKKDRHYKIVTARGPRDRRVRLSMDIARQFFDLQDLLGFDKASKTLDWLLTKSRSAIKELVKMKQIAEEDAAHLYSSEDRVAAGDNAGYHNSTLSTTKQELSVEEKKGERVEEKTALVFDSSVKELRARARARARERTVEKKRKRKLGEVFDSKPFFSDSRKSSCKTCDSELFCFCQPISKEEKEEAFEDLIVITKKMKPPTVSLSSSRDLHEAFGGVQQ